MYKCLLTISLTEIAGDIGQWNQALFIFATLVGYCFSFFYQKKAGAEMKPKWNRGGGRLYFVDVMILRVSGREQNTDEK